MHDTDNEKKNVFGIRLEALMMNLLVGKNQFCSNNKIVIIIIIDGWA
jgi:hypothetical protein